MLIFTSKRKQFIYDYLHSNKTGNRVQITYRELAEAANCTPTHSRKIILQLQDAGYVKVIESNGGTLLEVYAPEEMKKISV
jgi:DNA-binding IscR family transcriptional regulator